MPSDNYSDITETLVVEHVKQDGTPTVAWGRSCVSLVCHNDKTKRRMIRLRFAIGFGKLLTPGKGRITTANLVSTLAEFALIYDPASKTWVFGK